MLRLHACLKLLVQCKLQGMPHLLTEAGGAGAWPHRRLPMAARQAINGLAGRDALIPLQMPHEARGSKLSDPLEQAPVAMWLQRDHHPSNSIGQQTNAPRPCGRPALLDLAVCASVSAPPCGCSPACSSARQLLLQELTKPTKSMHTTPWHQRPGTNSGAQPTCGPYMCAPCIPVAPAGARRSTRSSSCTPRRRAVSADPLPLPAVRAAAAAGAASQSQSCAAQWWACRPRQAEAVCHLRIQMQPSQGRGYSGRPGMTTCNWLYSPVLPGGCDCQRRHLGLSVRAPGRSWPAAGSAA